MRKGESLAVQSPPVHSPVDATLHLSSHGVRFVRARPPKALKDTVGLMFVRLHVPVGGRTSPYGYVRNKPLVELIKSGDGTTMGALEFRTKKEARKFAEMILDSLKPAKANSKPPGSRRIVDMVADLREPAAKRPVGRKKTPRGNLLPKVEARRGKRHGKK
jgi:hypothetical protein